MTTPLRKIQLTGLEYTPGNDGIDSLSKCLGTIEIEHKKIHEGNHYYYCDYALNNASSSVIEFVFTASAGIYVHFTFTIYSSLGASIEVFEGSTGVTGGLLSCQGTMIGRH